MSFCVCKGTEAEGKSLYGRLFLMEKMILLSSQVNSEEPRNIPQAHWKQDIIIGAKSVTVPLGYIILIPPVIH